MQKDFMTYSTKTPLYSFSVVDLAWEFLVKIICKCADILCLLKAITTWNCKPAWITNEILEAVIDEAFIEAYESKNADLLTAAKAKRTKRK